MAGDVIHVARQLFTASTVPTDRSSHQNGPALISCVISIRFIFPLSKLTIYNPMLYLGCGLS